MGKILNLQYESPKTHRQSTGSMEIKNQTKNSADLYFYGDICSSSWDVWQNEDMCPQDVADFLNNLNGVQNINIYINSGGGDSFAGLAIFNILKRNGAHMDVYVDGLAASAASVIAMVGCLDGNTLHMPPGAQLMIHDAWTIAPGNANDFEQLVIQLRKCDQSYSEVYASCSNDDMTADQFRAMQDAETWMTGEEAAGYFKNIDASGEQIAASVDSMFFSKYKHVPASFLHKPVPKHKTETLIIHDGVIPSNISTDKAPDDTAWSKPTLSDFTDKQWGDLTEQEKRDIAGHYAWAEEMPPDTFGNLKYGHHDPKSHKVVFNGLVACAARIDQSDIPDADLPKVKAHLEDHYHDFGKKAPWESDDDDNSDSKAKLKLAKAKARAVLAKSKI